MLKVLPGWRISPELKPFRLKRSAGSTSAANTAIASKYYSKLPRHLGESMVVILDPMLATGGSALATLQLLHKAGATSIRLACIVAAPEGAELLVKADPSLLIFTCALDRELNAEKYILPGLGDFGDRLYGT